MDGVLILLGIVGTLWGAGAAVIAVHSHRLPTSHQALRQSHPPRNRG
jgi:hypothetical protein